MPPPNKRPAIDFTAFFSLALVECRAEVTAYGACITRSLAALEKDACAREFAGLRTCTTGALVRARSAARGKA